MGTVDGKNPTSTPIFAPELDPTVQLILNLSRLLMTFLMKTTIILSLLTFSHSYAEPKRNPCEGITSLDIGAQAGELHRAIWPIDRSSSDPTDSSRRHMGSRAGDLTRERQCWSTLDDRLRDNAAMTDVTRNVCVGAFEKTLCHMASYAVTSGMKDPRFTKSWCSDEYKFAYNAGQRCLEGNFASYSEIGSATKAKKTCPKARYRLNRASPLAFVPVLMVYTILWALISIVCASSNRRRH